LIGSKVSKRYAKALFSLGLEDGNYDQYGGSLKEFADFCQQNREFGEVIANPIFAPDERKKILQTVLEQSQFSALVKNFLFLLLDKNRIGAVTAISDYYSKLTDESSDVARAEIITAKPLKEDALARIEGSLAKMTSKKIKSQISEDQSLIGGIVVKLGDLVLDGSVRAQMEGLKESLKRGEID
jgi:F-type H+-transporting ATPase subunit delta